MTGAVTDEFTLVYEGPGVGTELLGAVQANFLAKRPGMARLEVAVLVNRPAIEFLAEELGLENTPEFAVEMARAVGQLWIPRRVASIGRFESIMMVSRSTLDTNPDLVDALNEARTPAA